MLRGWILALLLGGPAIAQAGCETDSDCKEDRICVEGECAAPPAASTPPTLANGLTDTQEKKLTSARGAGTAAFVFAGLSIASGTTAMAWDGAVLPQKIVAGSTVVVVIMATPIGYSGGGKARRVARTAGIQGPSPVVPAVAWVGYVAALSTGAYQAATGVSNEPLRGGLTAAVTTLGAGSAIAMGVDAHLSATWVEQNIGESVAVAGRPRLNMALGVLPRREGSLLTLSGSF